MRFLTTDFRNLTVALGLGLEHTSGAQGTAPSWRPDEPVCTGRRLVLFRWIAVLVTSLRAHAELQCREYVPAPYSVASDA